MNLNNLIPGIISAAMGFLFFWVGFYRWKERYFCKDIVCGICKRIVVHVQYSTYTEAVFEYYYAGRKRYHAALDDLSGKQRKYFREGESYALYVNPKKPDVCRCTKKVFKWEDLMLILIGEVVMGGGILWLFKV